MPQGPGCGRGGGRRRMLFLQSCLLVLLRREPGHGYSLAEGLNEFGFNPEQLDISILYRALRDLEARGLVSGTWNDNTQGPQKRVFTVTRAGRAELAGWMTALSEHRREIEALEAAYDQVVQEEIPCESCDLK